MLKTKATLRIASINILNEPLGNDDRYLRLGRHLKEEKVEVVALQEVVDNEALEEALRNYGFKYFHFGTPFCREGDINYDCNAIASKTPFDGHEIIDFNVEERNAAVVKFVIDKKNLYLASAHFAWGSDSEYKRLKQAMQLDSFAAYKQATEDAVFILGGDLNADENHRTIRYLKGYDLALNKTSTLWVDAFTFNKNIDEWATSDQGKDFYGPRTAFRHGINNPEMLPARRIDYLMSRGWVYGKVGCPINYKRFGGVTAGGERELSDHYGIIADFLL